MDYPRFACQTSAQTVWKYPAVQYLENRANTLENCAHNLWRYDPRILCRSIQTVWNFLAQKNVPSTLLDFCAWKYYIVGLECVPILSEKPIVVYLEICAHLMFYDPSNPYCTDCFSLLFVALKPVPASCLETHALALHMLPLSQARPLSCSFSPKIEWTTLARVRPPTLIDLMVASEEFHTNGWDWIRWVVEIERLFTHPLTKVIKSSFNLHLTN